ncbi:hypothetical protein J6590_091672 [Homalodisca vitripennis]|nr:hypothetical protein J6590_091672 [Homalodisca vitripennis]
MEHGKTNSHKEIVEDKSYVLATSYKEEWRVLYFNHTTLDEGEPNYIPVYSYCSSVHSSGGNNLSLVVKTRELAPERELNIKRHAEIIHCAFRPNDPTFQPDPYINVDPPPSEKYDLRFRGIRRQAALTPAGVKILRGIAPKTNKSYYV